jgi:purine nucleosidase
MSKGGIMKRLVIDTDPGVDDAHAILLAAAHPDAKIEALTTLGGNVSLEHTTANACKILDLLELDVPVYAGCAGALLERKHEDASHVHGADGLGDCGIPPSAREVEDEHAVQALIRLANENPGELTLVAIGPLTNVALATRLDPTLPSKYKELVIMGGAIYARGNTPNTAAEFNIYHDPEAAAIVFESWPELTMSSWETTMAYPISAGLLAELRSVPTPRGEFFDKIVDKIAKFIQVVLGRNEIYAADAMAVAIAIEPDIVTKAQKCYVQVERMGQYSRGQTIIDWFGLGGHTPNAHVVLELKAERFFELLRLSLQ